MPWQEVSIMDQRREFVFGLQCRRGRTGESYAGGLGFTRTPVTSGLAVGNSMGSSRIVLGVPTRARCGLIGRSRSVLSLCAMPTRPGELARSHAVLNARGSNLLQFRPFMRILRRHHRGVPASRRCGPPALREACAEPAVADGFQGLEISLADGSRCHPLTIVDDHSRYGLCLEACGNEQGSTVQGRLQLTFRRYGLPEAFFVDNGGPWGDSSGQRWTRLCVWLLKLGIAVLHSRPYHPQSRGKNERFHRTLNAEVLALRRFRDLAEVQRAFDAWRPIYNLERPHQALDQEVPASRYRPSPRSMRTAFHRWNTTSTKSCARFPSPRTTSGSRVGAGSCRERSVASASPSGRSQSTVTTASSSAPTRSQPST